LPAHFPYIKIKWVFSKNNYFRNFTMARGLIVDDSKFMRKIIRDALESGGHEVVAEADNGEGGLESFEKTRPDFITLDITMSGMDGLEALRRIKTVDPSARIVVISAMNEKTLRLNQRDIKADAFITKPFEKQELLQIIRKIL